MVKPRIAISYIKEGREPEKDEIMDAIETWANVDYLDPELEHIDISTEDFRREFDLYHMAKTRDQSLSDLGRAESNGIMTVNDYSAAMLVDDRYESMLRLKDVEDPNDFLVPETEFGRYEDITLKPPYVVQDRREGEGHEIEVHYDDVPFEGERVVQDFIDYDNFIKLYNLGDEVRTVGYEQEDSKVDRSYRDGVEIEPDSRIENVSQKIKYSIGLDLFEADVLEKDGDLYVVDVNSMAGMHKVSDAVKVYNDLILSKYEEGNRRRSEIYPEIV